MGSNAREGSSPSRATKVMEEFRFKGKTITELEQAVKDAEGFDENGHPNWYKAQADLEDAMTLKRIFEDATLRRKKED